MRVFGRTAFFSFSGGRSRTKLLLEIDFEVFIRDVKRITQLRAKKGILPTIPEKLLSDPKKEERFWI